jgi:cell division protein FtsB
MSANVGLFLLICIVIDAWRIHYLRQEVDTLKEQLTDIQKQLKKL